jgi:hypothetical protein
MAIRDMKRFGTASPSAKRSLRIAGLDRHAPAPIPGIFSRETGISRPSERSFIGSRVCLGRGR